MTKRMREIQALILEKSAAAKALLDGETKDLAKAETLLNEVDELQKELDLQARTEKQKKGAVPDNMEPVQEKGAELSEAQKSEKAFANAVRARFKDLNETTGADGGYTVPEDIDTRINTLREEHFSLVSLIDREAVTTKSGRRTYKQRAQHTGFTQVAEGGKVTKTAAPKFAVISYDIKKYGGFMPVTNELLEDSDAAITNTMTEWLAQESVATENAQILAKVNEKEVTALAGIKDIKKAVNVTLAAFAGSVRVVTNSDGLQYLDTLEDKNGRPLLSPDPVKPMELYLTVGVRRIPVTIIPNVVMPSAESGAIPFIIGDLYEYVKMFDRKQLTLTISDTAVAGDFNAYEQDMTLIRALMRADFVVKDEAAIVRGELTPATA